MKPIFNKAIGLALTVSIGVATLFAFQNCSGPSPQDVSVVQQSTDGSLFVQMSAAQAQSTIAPYEGAAGCSMYSSQIGLMTVLPANSSLVATASHQHQASVLNSISGSGGVVILGTGVNPGVNQVNQFTGNLTFCGFSVGQIVGGTGNLVIENGTLTTLQNYTGNVIIINGSYPTQISGFNGNIYVKSSSGEYSGRSYSSQ